MEQFLRTSSDMSLIAIVLTSIFEQEAKNVIHTSVPFCYTIIAKKLRYGSTFINLFQRKSRNKNLTPKKIDKRFFNVLLLNF